jgi:putative SOS response-associated peptidase YedK
MCGRYSLFAAVEEIPAHFGLSAAPAIAPRYNVAPTQLMPIVRPSAAGRECVLARWGLIPFWAKDRAIGNRLINARMETADRLPAFRSAYRARRCLVPADGYYEWQAQAQGKQPWRIRRRDGGLLAFAGLWEHWTDPDGQAIESYTVLTRDAPDGPLREIHARMPLILSPAEYARWIEAVRLDPAELPGMGLPADDLAGEPVGRRVNSPRNDDPDCARPVVLPD